MARSGPGDLTDLEFHMLVAKRDAAALALPTDRTSLTRLLSDATGRPVAELEAAYDYLWPPASKKSLTSSPKDAKV